MSEAKIHEMIHTHTGAGTFEIVFIGPGLAAVAILLVGSMPGDGREKAEDQTWKTTGKIRTQSDIRIANLCS